jgi:hypothetical protein
MSNHTWVSIGGCDIEVQSQEGKAYWDLQSITWAENEGRARGSLMIKEVYENLDCKPRIFLGYANEYGPQKTVVLEGVRFDPTSKGQLWNFTAEKVTREEMS